jgi:hypothetical protein
VAMAMRKISGVRGITLIAIGLLLSACDKWERRAEVPPPREKMRASVPTKLPIKAGGVVDLTINQDHTCVVLDTGTVQCLGGNDFGQLGNGSEGTDEINPVDAGVLRVTKVTSGVGFTCALSRRDKPGGTGTFLFPSCWGKNNYNQLGAELPADPSDPLARVGVIPSTEPAIPPGVKMSPGPPAKGKNYSRIPVDVVGLKETLGAAALDRITDLTPVSLTTEVGRGCFKVNSEVTCWGAFWEKLTAGTPDEPYKNDKPTAEYAERDYLGNAVSSLAFLRKDSCSINGGILQCIRVDQAGTDAKPIEIAAGGGDHACMTVKSTTHSAKIRCFGENNFGQLGTGKIGPRSDTPAGEVGGLPYDAPEMKIVQIAVGLNHTLVHYDNGKVFAWGNNAHGQIGNGTAGDPVLSPAEVPLPLPATAIAAGGNHSCAILNDRTAWCWGENLAGELGFSPQ